MLSFWELGAGQAGRMVFNSLVQASQGSSITISALSRADSGASFPVGINVIRTDYTPASLENALVGQDVVISMLGDAGMPLQKRIVDAAIVAGVQRIFPSEFGCRTYIDRVVALMPYFQQKRNLIEHLKTKEGSITWTALIPNPFFDEALKNTFHGYEPPNKYFLLDGGDAPYGTTNLRTIGLALFRIVSNPTHFQDSANRYVNIHSYILTQKDILAAVEKVSGRTFERHHVNSADLYEDALRRFRSRGPSMEKDLFAERDIIQCITYGKGEFLGLGDTRDENDWTERLGLPAENLEEDVRGVLEGTRP
ncbi:uncharacterized protein NECHADRAFT_88584 [Fusarium vanettenii 77-13-4]|uniref:NmrA-like domain-containing protein n=1 Tax=Fusarium vanettenii (strain ATCC MYA-4622 / CBS 123669 / FGSC 9596 / NRRL 45880 / 77-13-4) TaxID=660122 RepID=C7ZBX6_FUSV7|nr:uncharacterized protein NECHADRAFT_88584 [Fusarium vanettenii 77-13-4]EEU38443.1 hypothetical protein NECHADRAFT_88584 [Fusarium vanettenii 77-13-4]